MRLLCRCNEKTKRTIQTPRLCSAMVRSMSGTISVLKPTKQTARSRGHTSKQWQCRPRQWQPYGERCWRHHCPPSRPRPAPHDQMSGRSACLPARPLGSGDMTRIARQRGTCSGSPCFAFRNFVNNLRLALRSGHWSRAKFMIWSPPKTMWLTRLPVQAHLVMIWSPPKTTWLTRLPIQAHLKA